VALRSRDVAAALRRLLDDFSSSDKELLEDAFYVLGLVDGLPAVLRVLHASETSCYGLRSAGLKSLFELVRTFPDLLSQHQVAQEVHAVASAIAKEVSTADVAAAAAAGLPLPPAGIGVVGPGGAASAEGIEILRLAELLRGLLAAVMGM